MSIFVGRPQGQTRHNPMPLSRNPYCARCKTRPAVMGSWYTSGDLRVRLDIIPFHGYTQFAENGELEETPMAYSGIMSSLTPMPPNRATGLVQIDGEIAKGIFGTSKSAASEESASDSFKLIPPEQRTGPDGKPLILQKGDYGSTSSFEVKAGAELGGNRLGVIYNSEDGFSLEGGRGPVSVSGGGSNEVKLSVPIGNMVTVEQSVKDDGTTKTMLTGGTPTAKINVGSGSDGKLYGGAQVGLTGTYKGKEAGATAGMEIGVNPKAAVVNDDRTREFINNINRNFDAYKQYMDFLNKPK